MKRTKIGIAILTSVMVVSLVFGGFVFAKPPLNEIDSDNDKAEYVSDEIIVKFKGDKEPFRVIKLPAGKSVKEAEEEFEMEKDVEYAEPNYIAYAQMVPNDPYYGYQWHLDNPEYGGIQMEAAWDISTGDPSVVVAIVDTGIAYEDYDKYCLAPDLANTSFVSGYDFVNNDSHPNDDNRHGTHVAGTVAQSTNNSLGVAGVAFDTSLMPVKVLDRRGSGTYADVAEGIRFAADNGAKVINLSLGGTADSTTLKDAVAYAYNQGVTVVAACGNSNTNTCLYPAAYDDYVIAVGATQYDETKAPYSNYGPSLDLVAPGGNNNLDQNGDGYADGVLQQTFKNSRDVCRFAYYFFQGTSMATPHVAGTAALVIANGVTSPDNIRAALETTAEDLGDSNWDEIYGWGLVDAAAALTYVADNPPTVTITNPLDGDTISGTIEIAADATDDVGVVQVDFYVETTLIGTDTESPYSVSWDSTSVTDGTYTLTAVAIDTASQEGSDSISISVDNVNDAPLADAGPDQTVSDTDGNGVESVTLDGSGSYDPDGTITTWKWTEGDAVLGEAEVITYDFAVGIHTVTLTVTDDDGATASDDTVITVTENQAPVADAGPDQSAYVDETVYFDGSGSTDDGEIVSYDWDFGDGATGSGITVEHVYTTEGEYTVSLTVTDNGGLTDSDTAIVTVTSVPAMEVTITKHDARYRWAKNNNIGKVEVQINFQVDAGSSNAVVLKEVTDNLGTWSLESSEVIVKINGVRYVWPITLDANSDAIIDFGAQGVTLSAGDIVQISKMKLLNTAQGSHTLTAQVWAADNLIAENSLVFTLQSK